MPLKNLLDNIFEFIIQTNQPLSEIMNMPYWKFEAFIERLNKRNEEMKDRRKKEENEMKKQQQSSGIGNFNPSSFANKFKR
jgi:hypothetical protein